MNEKDIEKMIRKSRFTNPDHKRKLRERLFEQGRELDLDELAAVSGGMSLPEDTDSDWLKWHPSGEEKE